VYSQLVQEIIGYFPWLYVYTHRIYSAPSGEIFFIKNKKSFYLYAFSQTSDTEMHLQNYFILKSYYAITTIPTNESEKSVCFKMGIIYSRD